MATKLSSPTLTLSGSILNIQNVPHGTQFKIYSNNELQITINANIPQLDKPIITIDETILRWNDIANATEYIIKVNNNIIATVSNNNFDMTKYNDEGISNLKVSVIASDGNAYYQNSEPTEITYISPTLPAPAISLSGNTISWTAIPNAVTYSIIDNDNPIATTTSTSYDLSSLSVGTHNITVTSSGYGYFESLQSNVIIYTVEAVGYNVLLDVTTEQGTPEQVAVKFNTAPTSPEDYDYRTADTSLLNSNLYDKNGNEYEGPLSIENVTKLYVWSFTEQGRIYLNSDTIFITKEVRMFEITKKSYLDLYQIYE